MLLRRRSVYDVSGAAGTCWERTRAGAHEQPGRGQGNVWARPGMAVTFRAELMPGRSAAERTFHITRVLPSCRVVIKGISGEHTAAEFELKV